MTEQLGQKLPRLAIVADAVEHEALAFMDLPKDRRDLLERLNREIKRRGDVVGISPTKARSAAWRTRY